MPVEWCITTTIVKNDMLPGGSFCYIHTVLSCVLFVTHRAAYTVTYRGSARGPPACCWVVLAQSHLVAGSPALTALRQSNTTDAMLQLKVNTRLSLWQK